MTTAGPGVVIVNPLGAALLHYTRALRRTVERSGARVEVIAIDEPSVAGTSRRAWVVGYLAALHEARRRSGCGTMIVTWPVLGYLDVVLLRLLTRRGQKAQLVMHDPEPLVQAVGYSAPVRRSVRLLSPVPCLILHSEAAREVLLAQGLADMATVLPHPMLREAESPGRDTHRPVVRVLGQYKADRDIALMIDVAAALGGTHDLEVWGRGWPSVPGWSVHEGFVSEVELDGLLRSADAVLIPYRRFYQSGVAIRAVESDTAVVGPRDSSLTDLYALDSPLLVPTGAPVAEWVEAIRAACVVPSGDLKAIAEAAGAAAAQRWRDWLTGPTTGLGDGDKAAINEETTR